MVPHLPRWIPAAARRWFFWALTSSCLLGAHAQPHWPQFRGPNGQGISLSASPPLHFSSNSNILWQTPLQAGHSSPVIWGDRIFLTTHRGDSLAVVALDRGSGRILWEWTVPAGPTGDVHPTSSPAAPSCAADADRVYAYFGSWGLAALGHEGREIWRRPMPPPSNRYGMATSPILHGELVILVLDTDDAKSRILACHASDGSTAWEAPRPNQRATWSTPAIWTPADGDTRREELIVLSAMRLSAYRPSDGSELWSLDGFPQETVSIPAIGTELVFAGAAALGGRGDERYEAMSWKELLAFDRNGDGLVQAAEVPDDFRQVLRPDLPLDHPGRTVPSPFKRSFSSRDRDHDGALSESEWNESMVRWEASSRPVLMAVRPGSPSGTGPHAARVAWKTARGLPEMPSLLLLGDRLFFIRDGGLLSCYEAPTGRLRYQERVGAPGQYCASPVAAGDRVYLTSVSGMVTVVDAAAPELHVLARNQVEGPIHATPGIAGTALYVRSATHLTAFGSPPPKP